MTLPGDSSGVFGGPERRQLDRRTRERGRPDRRRQSRQRQARTVLLAAAMSSFPAMRPMVAMLPVLKPSVEVSTEFSVVPASEAYADIIQEAATTYDVEPALIHAVMQAESALHPFVASRTGAEGHMPLIPERADEISEEIGVGDSVDPRENIMGGVRYLKQLLDHHGGDLDLALASYDAGPGTVARYGGVPPFKETRNYVETVKLLLATKRPSDAD